MSEASLTYEGGTRNQAFVPRTPDEQGWSLSSVGGGGFQGVRLSGYGTQASCYPARTIMHFLYARTSNPPGKHGVCDRVAVGVAHGYRHAQNAYGQCAPLLTLRMIHCAAVLTCYLRDGETLLKLYLIVTGYTPQWNDLN
ncbi:hypothetical protein FIBSPDRAFT_887752 [Athelia psychrophila]|uniref:Uncharacterized protein n=1 Tax=Athelia psychrophila TaxID=1759441 RepID=A0A166P6Y0_9AGAM|nr:hypothetical protein FIBSPDRAFT_887752 [Fibularhizoctonia sp. CBS 109695]